MPLYPNALALIRANFEALQRGERVKLIAIGTLTAAQLAEINASRASHGEPLITPEVVFLGSHTYRSRVDRDGYTIEDVLDQIESAMDAAATAIHNPARTIIHNRTGRADRYGNIVKDLAVLECTGRYPRPELFSVMPKGDFIKPPKK